MADIRAFFGGGGGGGATKPKVAPRPASPAKKSSITKANASGKAKSAIAKESITTNDDDDFELGTVKPAKAAASSKKKKAAANRPAMVVKPKPEPKAAKAAKSKRVVVDVFSHMDFDDDDNDTRIDDRDAIEERAVSSSKGSSKKRLPASENAEFIDDGDDELQPVKKSKPPARKKRRRIADDEEDLIDWGEDDAVDGNDGDGEGKNGTVPESKITKHFTHAKSQKALTAEENDRLDRERAAKSKADAEAAEKARQEEAARKRRAMDIQDEDAVLDPNTASVMPDSRVPEGSTRSKVTVKREIDPNDFFGGGRAATAAKTSTTTEEPSTSSKQSKPSPYIDEKEVVELDSGEDEPMCDAVDARRAMDETASIALARQLQAEEDAAAAAQERQQRTTPKKSPAKPAVKSSTPNKKRKVNEIVDVDVDNDDVIVKEQPSAKKRNTPVKAKPELSTQPPLPVKSTTDRAKDEVDALVGADLYSSAPVKEEKKKVTFWGKSAQADRPASLGLIKVIPEGDPLCLNNLTFVVTGILDSLEREEAEILIKKYGGRVTSSVSGRTDYLLAGEQPGESKAKKAAEHKTKIIDEDGLFQLIRARKGPKGVITAAPTRPTKTTAKAQLAAAEVADANKSQSVMSEEATRTVHGYTVQSVDSLLWVDKHRPQNVKGIIGNTSQVENLSKYLRGWHSGLKIPEFKRAALLTGGPGIGKSTSAALVAKQAGFQVIELNASDVRNKTAIQNVIGELTSNTALADYFPTVKGNEKPDTKTLPKRAGRKTVLIMDEVDGISGNEDRGGAQALTQLIKKTRIPIICIANDSSSPKMKTLKNYCASFVFRRPQANQAEPRISAICKAEGLRVERQAIEHLYDQTHGDIRQTLNFLQMWTETHDTLTFDHVTANMASGAKDLDMNVFGTIPELFRDPSQRAKDWIGDREQIYFLDSGLVPLFVQDGYVRGRPRRDIIHCGAPRNDQVHALMTLSMAADSISDGDLMSSKIFGDQDYSFMPAHALLSTVRPAWLMSGAGLGGGVSFPIWLGQNSSRNKRTRLVNEMKLGMKLDAPTDFNTLITEYAPLLRSKLILPLAGPHGGERIDAVIEEMDEYGLIKEDWDTLMEVTQPLAPPRPPVELTPSTKSAFTRKYNKGAHQLKVNRMKLKGDDGITRGNAAKLNADELEVNDDDANVEPGEADGEDGDEDAGALDEGKLVKSDPMIKLAKAPPKRSTAAQARTSSAKSGRGGREAGGRGGKTASKPRKKKKADSDDDFIDDNSDFE